MLYVLLVILKVIGIVILAILLTLLFLLILVLFVPIRYQVYASKNAKVYAKGSASWLLHMLHISFYFDADGIRRDFKILGITSDKWKSIIVKIKNFFTIKKKHKNTKIKKSKDINIKNKQNKNRKVEEKLDNDNTSNISKSNSLEVKESDELPEQIQSEQQKSQDMEQNIPNQIGEEVTKTKVNHPIQTIEDVNYKEGKSPSYYIKKWYEKVKRIIKTLFIKIKNFINNIIVSFKNAQDKLDGIKAFLQDEGNKQAFILCKEQLKVIIKHTKPKKYKINLKFGTGDPALTGQILGIIGLLMPFYKNNAIIIPDFENMVFEGDIFMKGRITLARALLIGWKLYRDENVKRCYKMIMD